MSGRADVVCGSHQVARDHERCSGIGPAFQDEPSATWPLASSLTLAALPTAPSCARLHAGAVLTEWGLTHVAETAELVVSELVTNAVQASTEDITGRLRYELASPGLPVAHLRLLSDGAQVVAEVWDNNPQPPVAKQAALDDESGRGLMLVEAVCERWSWHTLPGWPGKVVWAELRTNGGAR